MAADIGAPSTKALMAFSWACSLIFFLLLLDRVHKKGTRNICTVHAVSGAQAAQDDIILQTAVVAGCADFQVILAATLYYWGIRYVQIGSSQLDLYFLRISQYLLNLFTELAVLDLLFLINDACITAWYVSIWLQRLLYADRDILLTLAEQFRQAVQSYANGIHGIWVVLVSLTHTHKHTHAHTHSTKQLLAQVVVYDAYTDLQAWALWKSS